MDNEICRLSDEELILTLSENIENLKIELGGIHITLAKYISKGNIINYLDNLNTALSEKNIRVIKYCLREIKSWYDNNINRINANNWTNKYDHRTNKRKIEEFYTIFEQIPDDIKIDTVESVMCNNSNKPIIFLSHKSDDKKYADALEQFFVGLGVKNEQLIYTSHPLHKIPLDENIYEYLKKNINGNVFMIILWSNKYLESPACLNEMGAVWVVQGDYTNIYVPDFSFGNPKYHECAVDTRKMGAVLNGDAHCKANMIELKNKIQALFNLNNDEQQSAFLIDQFITEIKSK